MAGRSPRGPVAHDRYIPGYVGTVALFERGGFERVRPTTSRSGGRPGCVMRRTLHPVDG